ncbi:MAG TPA: phage major capsid protein [Pirellulales bacterium]|nr:phage major capsid protein [Pirellulales bacterium]
MNRVRKYLATLFGEDNVPSGGAECLKFLATAVKNGTVDRKTGLSLAAEQYSADLDEAEAELVRLTEASEGVRAESERKAIEHCKSMLAKILSSNLGIDTTPPTHDTTTAGQATDKPNEKENKVTTPKDSAVQPADVFSHGAPRVKRASETYQTTKARKVYPVKGDGGRVNDHPFAGRDVSYMGRPAYDQSELEKAYSGVWLKHKILGMANMSDHEKDLYMELLEKRQFVGEFRDPNLGEQYWGQPKSLSAMQRKTYIEDSTSGGTYLVPYFFDLDVVTYPLLYGQLFPEVDLREMATSNQVKTPTIGNLTTNEGPAEDTDITLQTTTGLSTVLTSSVFNFTGSLQIGRDTLADSPVNLQSEFLKLFNVSQLAFLEKEIATGGGVTGILGLVNTSGTQTYTSKNGTTGPWTVSDIEGMIKALPKQYRPGPATKGLCWFACDSAWWRIRGISVSSTDQRRIFGYSYDSYVLNNNPFKIEQDIGGSTTGYGRLDLYRLWRRLGMQLQVTIEGRTLGLLNDALIIARTRWAGQHTDPNAIVLCTSSPLH